MKGVLFKYDADPNDPLMRDRESSCVVNYCAIRDPDFWLNTLKVWGICGPYVRTTLNKGDVVFFLPKKKSLKKDGPKYYICTGILVVDRKLSDRKAVLKEPNITATYKRSWEKDLDIHLERDRNKAPRTARIRGKNFIVGDEHKSVWLGRNENYLKGILRNVGLASFVDKLNQRRINNIHGNKVELLYNKLTK